MGYSDFKRFDTLDCAFRNSKGKVKPAPEFARTVRVADTHCHLNMLENPGYALARAAAHGVAFLCCITDPAEKPYAQGEDAVRLSARQSYSALEEWLAQARAQLDAWGMKNATLPRVRFACGVHPHNAQYWVQAQQELYALLDNPKTCCLGEIGLDYHYDFSPRDAQCEVFAAQLRIANELNIPVSLHLREAHGEALEILRCEGVPQAGCILHCFNLARDDLAPFLDLGCYVAFGGPLTFRKSWYTRAASVEVPVERLLTETDAPYMAPEPLRGTVCLPDFTVFTLRTLLDCFGYAGAERARELVMPRQVDIDAGVAAPPERERDYEALQAGRDEESFCEQLYDNAIRLLDSR